jgi:CRISPR/Cas system CSM-associated protein Csm3 (group 7 of RAMP superfamily)
MSFTPVDPGYRFVDLTTAERTAPPDRLIGLWGELSLQLATDVGVHVGSGVPVVFRDDHLAHGTSAVRRLHDHVWKRKPVIPGSSLKGAIRAIAEALTPSCDPFGDGRCREGDRVCPACTMFGNMGTRGRIGFADAVTDAETAVTHIAQRYSHQHAPDRGRRIYRTTPETPQPQRREALEVVRPPARFTTTLTFHGLPDWGAGVLLIALGVAPHGLPHVRVGGGKNRGLGIVTVEVTAARVGEGLRHALLAETLDDATHLGEKLTTWQDAAIRHFPGLPARRDEIARILGS